MIRLLHPSLGLLGRILAILLLTVTIEFGVSTLLYERAGRVSIREDEARRLAEHLVIARKLIAERPWDQRQEMSQELSTDRYDVRWSPTADPAPPLSADLVEMRRQIIAWEPTLGQSDLRLRLPSPGRNSVALGATRLPDGSWLRFHMHGAVDRWELAVGRILLALVPAVALLVIGGSLIGRQLAPLRMLARAAQRIGHGEEEILPETGTGEVRRVIHAFNEMQQRIHGLIADRTQALAAVGHDLRTPLARLQLRLDQVDDDAARHAIAGDVAEMEAMVASLLAFLNGDDDPEERMRIDVAVMAATLIDDVADRGREGHYIGPEHCETLVRPVGFKRALANLVENALHYGDTVWLTLAPEADRLLIRVEDDGPGIPEDRLADVLRPFTRLDPARGRNTQGLGLGLAIVARAVAREGGTIVLRNRPEGGLCAEIMLPRP